MLLVSLRKSLKFSGDEKSDNAGFMTRQQFRYTGILLPVS